MHNKFNHKSKYNAENTFPGINLITRIGNRDRLVAEVRSLDNKIIHSWDVDWFKIWPDAKHISNKSLRPRGRPGTTILGALLMKDGRLIFNFEHLGLVCLDKEGTVVWKLDYQTHHSVELDQDGTILVGGAC